MVTVENVRPEDILEVKARDLKNADVITIARRLAGAMTYIENEVGRAFFSGALPFTQTSNGTGKDRLILVNAPVLSISSVLDTGRLIPPAASVTDSGWILDATVGILWLRRYLFSRGIQNVVVAGTYGYTKPPADIWEVAINSTVRKMKRQPLADVQSIAVQGETTTYVKDDFTPEEITIMGNYERWI